MVKLPKQIFFYFFFGVLRCVFNKLCCNKVNSSLHDRVYLCPDKLRMIMFIVSCLNHVIDNMMIIKNLYDY